MSNFYTFKVLTRSRMSFDTSPGEEFNKALVSELAEGWVVVGKILFNRDHSIISVVLGKKEEE